MSFKEELTKKMTADALTRRVLTTLAEPGDIRKTDLDAMRMLLRMGPFRYAPERDLHLYIWDESNPPGKILVLDNELPIYRTSAADVGLRKSPTIKEMISIRNAVRILNDADVVVSKKEKSAMTIRSIILQRMALSYTGSDLAEIAKDAAQALGEKDEARLWENLILFGELLGWTNAPKPFEVKGCRIIGKSHEAPSGEARFGPAVGYDAADGALRMYEETASTKNRDIFNQYKKTFSGEDKSAAQGEAVFRCLQTQVLRSAYNPENLSVLV